MMNNVGFNAMRSQMQAPQLNAKAQQSEVSGTQRVGWQGAFREVGLAHAAGKLVQLENKIIGLPIATEKKVEYLYQAADHLFHARTNFSMVEPESLASRMVDKALSLCGNNVDLAEHKKVLQKLKGKIQQS